MIEKESKLFLKITKMNYKVLVVEDFAPARKSFQDILEVLGCTYVLAADGLEAIHKLRNNTFDVILMDLQMPILNGFETTEHIRRNLPYPSNTIPIIIMTGWDYAEDLSDTYKDEGFDGFLQKPFSLEALENELKEVIENKDSVSTNKFRL